MRDADHPVKSSPRGESRATSTPDRSERWNCPGCEAKFDIPPRRVQSGASDRCPSCDPAVRTDGSGTERFDVRIGEDLQDSIESGLDSGLYQDRSEAIRDAIRHLLTGEVTASDPHTHQSSRVETSTQTTRITVRVPPAMHSGLKSIAADLGTNRSVVVRIALQQFSFNQLSASRPQLSEHGDGRLTAGGVRTDD